MTKYPRSILWVLPVLALACILCAKCTKPELIGADLLENEAAQVVFTDTLSLKCSHVVPGPLLTYSSETGSRIIRNVVGHLDDPFFGKTEASFYTEMFLLTGSSAFLERQIDSVVLALRYDTLGVYGDPTQPVLMSINRLTEQLNRDQEYLTDYQPAIDMQPIALQMINPRPYDSLEIQSRGDTLRVPPMVRLKMEQFFIDDMLAQDSSTFESSDSFRLWMKGIHVSVSQADNHMLGFDLDDLYSEMTVYYRNDADTFSAEVSFVFSELAGSGIHHTYLRHEREGSELQKFLDDQSLADSLLFIQGLAGVDVGIALPGLSNLQNILINKAELEFYVADVPDNNLNFYPVVPQLINAVEDEDGRLALSEDVEIVLNRFGLLDPFGGRMMADSSALRPVRYMMNVTTSLQDIQKGETENMFFITPFISANVPNRVILYGPGHPQYPARLRLAYTVVQ